MKVCYDNQTVQSLQKQTNPLNIQARNYMIDEADDLVLQSNDQEEEEVCMCDFLEGSYSTIPEELKYLLFEQNFNDESQKRVAFWKYLGKREVMHSCFVSQTKEADAKKKKTQETHDREVKACQTHEDGAEFCTKSEIDLRLKNSFWIQALNRITKLNSKLLNTKRRGCKFCEIEKKEIDNYTLDEDGKCGEKKEIEELNHWKTTSSLAEVNKFSDFDLEDSKSYVQKVDKAVEYPYDDIFSNKSTKIGSSFELAVKEDQSMIAAKKRSFETYQNILKVVPNSKGIRVDKASNTERTEEYSEKGSKNVRVSLKTDDDDVQSVLNESEIKESKITLLDSPQFTEDGRLSEGRGFSERLRLTDGGRFSENRKLSKGKGLSESQSKKSSRRLPELKPSKYSSSTFLQVEESFFLHAQPSKQLQNQQAYNVQVQTGGWQESQWEVQNVSQIREVDTTMSDNIQKVQDYEAKTQEEKYSGLIELLFFAGPKSTQSGGTQTSWSDHLEHSSSEYEMQCNKCQNYPCKCISINVNKYIDKK